MRFGLNGERKPRSTHLAGEAAISAKSQPRPFSSPLFTELPRRGILRTSPCRISRKFVWPRSYTPSPPPSRCFLPIFAGQAVPGLCLSVGPGLDYGRQGNGKASEKRNCIGLPDASFLARPTGLFGSEHWRIFTDGAYFLLLAFVGFVVWWARKENRRADNTRVTPPQSTTARGVPIPKRSRTIPQDVKIAVSVRDQGKCRVCGSTQNLHYDHIIPYSRGGSSNDPDNIQLLCGYHNRLKRDR